MRPITALNTITRKRLAWCCLLAMLATPARADIILNLGNADPLASIPMDVDVGDELVLAALRGNDFATALELAKNRVALYSRDRDTHLLLALAWVGQNDEVALNRHLLELRTLAPDLFTHVSYGIGVYYARQHQFFQALRYLQAVPEYLATADLLQVIGEIRDQQGDIASTIAAYETLSRKAPDDTDGLLALARLYLLNGDFDRSLLNSKRLLSATPDEIAPLVLSGTAEMMKGDMAAARNTFAEIAEAEPGNQMPWTQLGMLDLLEKTPEEALASFIKANAIENCDEAFLGITYAALLTGDNAAAESASRNVLQMKDLGAMAQAAAALHRGDARNANAAYRRAAGIFIDFGFGNFDIGAYSTDTAGDATAATLLVIANDLYRQGYFAMTKSFLEQHKALVDSHAFLELTYARAAWKSGDMQTALAAFERMQSQYPGLVAPWIEAADIAFFAGDMDKVLAGYQHAVTLQESDELRLRLATLYNHMQRPDDALKELNIVLTHQPDSTYVLDQIASTYIELKNDAQTALPYVERGMLKDADSPDLRNTLAKIYYRLDRFDESAALYEQLLPLNIASSAFYYDAGMSLQKADKPMLAADAFKRVLNGGPTSAEYGTAEREYHDLMVQLGQ